jgi:hypothetical protein
MLEQEHRACEEKENDGFAGGNVGALPQTPGFGALPATSWRRHKQQRKRAGPEPDPSSRMAIRRGAPVASQQSRILRADGRSVSCETNAGKPRTYREGFFDSKDFLLDSRLFRDDEIRMKNEDAEAS